MNATTRPDKTRNLWNAHQPRTAYTLVLWLGAVLLFAAPAQAESLYDIYQQAQKQDATLASARARHAAIEQARPITRSDLLPQLHATAEWSHHDDNYKDVPLATQSIYKDSQYQRKSYRVELNQTLYNREQWLAYKQSGQEISQADATLKLVEQDLLLRTAKAYFDLLGAQDNLRFAQAEKKAIAHQLYQARQRFELGLSTITDISDAEAQYDLATAQEIDARYQLSVVKEDLRVITGQQPGHLSPLKASIGFKAPPENQIQTWVQTALEKNPALIAARHRAKVAEAELKKRKAGHLPTLDLTAKYSNDDENGGTSEGINSSSSVGLQLKVPLYSGGRVSAEVAEARNLLRQAQKEFELKKRETSRETRAAYLNVRATLARISALSKAVRSTQTAAKAAETGYKEGIRTAVDVLLALRENFRAKRDYTKARYDFILSTLRLKQACGTLSESDLKQIDSWLMG